MAEVATLFDLLHGDDEGAALDAARALAGAEVVAVSACLLGVACRYDGRDRLSDLAGLTGKTLLPLCPEVLAGLGVPREPVHFDSAGHVVASDGSDVTAALERGAARAQARAHAAGVRLAVLKERSPSCGVHEVHGPDGVQSGQGVFARRLADAGVELRTEEDR